MSGKGKGGGSNAEAEAAMAIMQSLEMQSQMQTMLIDGYGWAFDKCTAAGSGPQLSQKEIRCIQSGIALIIDARTHMAQAGAGGKH